MPWLLAIVCALWVFTGAQGIPSAQGIPDRTISDSDHRSGPVLPPDQALWAQAGESSPATPEPGTPEAAEPEADANAERTGQSPTESSGDAVGSQGSEEGQRGGIHEVETLPGGARRGVYQGRLESVNVESNEVVIAPADREEKVRARVEEGVPVFVEGRLGGRNDLEEGQQVRASFEERKGTTRLRWIEVHEAGDLDAPPGVGGTREGIGGTHGGAQEPTSSRSAASQEQELSHRATSTGSGTQETDPPPGNPQGSTGIHGDQTPGEQYVGEGQEADSAQEGSTQRKPPSDERDAPGPGSSGIAETQEMMAPPATAGERGQPGLNEVEGVVVSANVADHELVISHDGRELTLRVPAGATVLVEGRRGTLDSLEAGTPVRASLATEDESPIAVWVETMDQMPSEATERDAHPNAPELEREQ